MSAINGQFGYLDASIWQYCGKYECEKTIVENVDGLIFPFTEYISVDTTS